MFKQAVTRLTLRYLAVIMLLSFMFTFALYNVSTRELNDLQERQESLLRSDLPLPPQYARLNQDRIDQIAATKHNIAFNLAYFNLVILAMGGAVSYFLALRTLKPIEEAVEAQNRFTGDASHELRTPLTAMKAELEVALRDKKLTLAESKQLHASTLEEIEKLEALTNGLLKLSKQDGQERAAFNKVQLEAVIAEARKRVAGKAKARSIVLEQEVEPVYLLADQWALTELVTILLDNAIKYSPEGSKVQIQVSRSKHTAFIRVKDQGVGIKASDIPYIFNRFYRADIARSKEGVEGYGLGLSIANKIVETHQGEIEVKSLPGSGSTFTVKIPLTPPTRAWF